MTDLSPAQLRHRPVGGELSTCSARFAEEDSSLHSRSVSPRAAAPDRAPNRTPLRSAVRLRPAPVRIRRCRPTPAPRTARPCQSWARILDTREAFGKALLASVSAWRRHRERRMHAYDQRDRGGSPPESTNPRGSFPDPRAPQHALSRLEASAINVTRPRASSCTLADRAALPRRQQLIADHAIRRPPRRAHPGASPCPAPRRRCIRRRAMFIARKIPDVHRFKPPQPARNALPASE